MQEVRDSPFLGSESSQSLCSLHLINCNGHLENVDSCNSLWYRHCTIKTSTRGNACRMFRIRLSSGVNPVTAWAALISSTVMAIWKTLKVSLPRRKKNGLTRYTLTSSFVFFRAYQSITFFIIIFPHFSNK